MAAPTTVVPVNVDPQGLLMRDVVAKFFSDLDLTRPLEEHYSTLGSAGYDLSGLPPRERLQEAMRQRYLPQLNRVLTDASWSTVVVEWGDFATFNEAASLILSRAYSRFENFVNEGLLQALTEFQPLLLAEKGREGRPPQLCVAFVRVPSLYSVRTLRSANVGELCSVSGTVTRTSQVRPELLVGVFTCNDCGTDSQPIEQQFRYTEPPACRNEECECKSRFRLNVGHKETRFGDWQKIRIQENANQIPVGCMPRSMEVIVRNDAVEVAKPGDRVVLTGYAVAVPEVAKLFNALNRREVQRNLSGVQRAMMDDNQGQNLDGATGLRALGVRDLNYRLCFCATTVADINGDERKMTQAVKDQVDPDQGPMEMELTYFEKHRIREMRALSKGNILKYLARCVAPNIFKHDLVKTGLLLQIVGGVPKVTMEKIHLRGDINCCIVGDPSTAKSQFLKWVSHNVPRGIYTSGKASTASGLTATVTRDSDTGERTIEAGALMLSDNGICCIDEFDQMDASDQVAIHEAMEQQTISIAKAGIKATLNARTSLLAALNPLGGKYDRRKPLAKNIAMTGPIMSRFDLMFVIVDEANTEADRTLAENILNLHRNGELAAQQSIFTTEDWALYVKYARTLTPMLTEEASQQIVQAYKQMRIQDSLANRSKVYRVTTRLLESIIRLSEATAKIYLSEEVKDFHVEIALDIMRQSLTTLEMTQVELTTDFVKEEPAAAPSPSAPIASGPAAAGQDTARETEQTAGRPKRKKPRAEAGASKETSPVQPEETPAPDALPAAQAPPPPAPQKKKLTITSDQYNRLVNWFTTQIYRTSRTEYPTTEKVLKEYLATIPTTDTEQLAHEFQIAQLVLRKLLHEGTLLETTSVGPTSEGTTQPPAPGQPAERRLMLHPNFNPNTLSH